MPLTVLKNLGLVLVSVVFAFILFESILALLNFPTQPFQRIKHSANMVEQRTNLEFSYVFETNDQGLRYDTIPLTKDSSEFRVFVAGDSFVEGVGVNNEDRFSNQLEKSFSTPSKPVKFVNGGLSGTGPLQYLRLFEQVGLSYQPDMLMLCIYMNDLANTPEKLVLPLSNKRQNQSQKKSYFAVAMPRLSAVIQTYFDNLQYHNQTSTNDFISTVRLRAEKTNIDVERFEAWRSQLPAPLIEAVNKNQFNGGIFSFGLFYPDYWADSIDLASDRAKKKWLNMRLILDRIVEKARQNGIPTAIVLLPAPFLHDETHFNDSNPWLLSGANLRKEWLTQNTPLQAGMQKWSQNRDLPFLDLTPHFRNLNSKVNYPLDGHWNPKGHSVASKAIENWLRSEMLIEEPITDDPQ